MKKKPVIYCEIVGKEVTIEPTEMELPMQSCKARLIVNKFCSCHCEKQGQCSYTESERYNVLCDGTRVRIP